ncbi:MAG: hypothetical protein ABIP93_19505 [Gemmatimonadaceae bacterium]
MRTTSGSRSPWLRLARSTMLMFICGVSACELTTEPLPTDAVLFEPPAVYARWWKMTEACSGRSGDLAALRWYRVQSSSVTYNRRSFAGFWSANENWIVLARGQDDNGAAVRHEMLHALIQGSGHPRAEFLEACASLVACSSECIADGEPWRAPQQEYVVFPPDSLEVDSEAQLLARETDGQRWLRLQLTVRNPRGRAVLITAPGDAVSSGAFAAEVRGPTGNITRTDNSGDSSAMFFRPYEAKTRLFEFRVASELTSYRVPSGTHLVRGGYARRWAAYDTVIVGP